MRTSVISKEREFKKKKNELKEIAPDALKPQTEEGAALNPVPSQESLAD